MQIILKKTVNSKFRAGSVIKGEEYRLRRLVNKGVAVADSNKTSTFGAVINIFAAAAMAAFALFIIFNQEMDLGLLPYTVKLDQWGFVVATTIYALAINLAYLWNKRLATQAIAFGLITSFIGGIMVAVGDNKLTSKYEKESMKRVKITTTSFFLLTAATFFVIMFVFDRQNIWNDQGTQDAFETYAYIFMYVGLLVTVIVGAILDRQTNKKRKSFIGWIIKVNERDTERKLVKTEIQNAVAETTREARLELDRVADEETFRKGK